jgi:hypothetical protein
MKIFYLWPAVITLLFAGMSEYSGGTFSTISDYVTSNPTSQAAGVITQSDYKLIGRWGATAHDIRYRYTVKNREFSGSRVDYRSKTNDYAKVLQKYPLGRQVTVYYDPSRPRSSTLERSALGFHIYGQLVVLFFSYGFFAWLEVRLRKTKKIM